MSSGAIRFPWPSVERTGYSWRRSSAYSGGRADAPAGRRHERGPARRRRRSVRDSIPTAPGSFGPRATAAARKTSPGVPGSGRFQQRNVLMCLRTYRGPAPHCTAELRRVSWTSHGRVNAAEKRQTRGNGDPPVRGFAGRLRDAGNGGAPRRAAGDIRATRGFARRREAKRKGRRACAPGQLSQHHELLYGGRNPPCPVTPRSPSGRPDSRRPVAMAPSQRGADDGYGRGHGDQHGRRPTPHHWGRPDGKRRRRSNGSVRSPRRSPTSCPHRRPSRTLWGLVVDSSKTRPGREQQFKIAESLWATRRGPAGHVRCQA